jgi:hypothetical protein
LEYVYTNLRLLAEGKKKDEKKWYIDIVDIEDSDSLLEEEVEEHGDLDLDGWDNRNLGVRDSYGGTNHSPHAPGRDRARDLEDEYTFWDEKDEHFKDMPSIAAFVNGDGLLNSDNILRKSSTFEDVEDVFAIKASNIDEIGTKDGEAMKKNNCVFFVEGAQCLCERGIWRRKNFDPISSSGANHGEVNSYGWGQQSPMSSGPSRALFESSSMNLGMVKLGSLRGLVSLLKVHPQVKEEDGYHSLSNANMPIDTKFKRSQPRPPPRASGLSHGKQLLALTKIKHKPIGGP